MSLLLLPWNPDAVAGRLRARLGSETVTVRPIATVDGPPSVTEGATLFTCTDLDGAENVPSSSVAVAVIVYVPLSANVWGTEVWLPDTVCGVEPSPQSITQLDRVSAP